MAHGLVALARTRFHIPLARYLTGGSTVSPPRSFHSGQRLRTWPTTVLPCPHTTYSLQHAFVCHYSLCHTPAPSSSQLPYGCSACFTILYHLARHIPPMLWHYPAARRPLPRHILLLPHQVRRAGLPPWAFHRATRRGPLPGIVRWTPTRVPFIHAPYRLFHTCRTAPHTSLPSCFVLLLYFVKCIQQFSSAFPTTFLQRPPFFLTY